MSSLGAVQADGYYYHPDYRKEDGSLSRWNGSKGANQNEQRGVIRFEFPFDGWCLSCDARYSKGSRFNAKKEKDGMYHSTTVWRFTMKCNACVQQFVIKTDPRNSTYDYFQGLRKKDEDRLFESDDQLIISNFESEDGGRALAAVDPIAALQKDQNNKARAATKEEQLAQLEDFQGRTYYDADANSVLRHAAREARIKSRTLLLQGRDKGLNIPLAEESDEDALQARRAMLERTVSAKARPGHSRGELRAIMDQPLVFKADKVGKKRRREDGAGGGSKSVSSNSRHSGSSSSSSSSRSSGGQRRITASALQLQPEKTSAEAESASTPPLQALAMLCQYGDDDDDDDGE